jgi:hypothetical protein
MERLRSAQLCITVAAGLSVSQIYSLEWLELLRLHLHQVIHDLGADVGTWTLLAKALYPLHVLLSTQENFCRAAETVGCVHLHEIGLTGVSDKSLVEQRIQQGC